MEEGLDPGGGQAEQSVPAPSLPPAFTARDGTTFVATVSGVLLTPLNGPTVVVSGYDILEYAMSIRGT